MKSLLCRGMIILMLVVGQAAWADSPTPPVDGPPQLQTMDNSQLQGLACIGTGVFGALIAYAYTDLLVVTGTVMVNPVVIFAPVVATGFAFGCSIGSNVAPGLFWLHAKLRGPAGG